MSDWSGCIAVTWAPAEATSASRNTHQVISAKSGTSRAQRRWRDFCRFSQFVDRAHAPRGIRVAPRPIPPAPSAVISSSSASLRSSLIALAAASSNARALPQPRVRAGRHRRRRASPDRREGAGRCAGGSVANQRPARCAHRMPMPPTRRWPVDTVAFDQNAFDLGRRGNGQRDVTTTRLQRHRDVLGVDRGAHSRNTVREGGSSTAFSGALPPAR